MSRSDVILALDQSTSATKAAAFRLDGTILADLSLSHSSSFPQPGWVEQDADILTHHSLEVLQKVLAQVVAAGSTPRALGITNQRETVVVWDRRTGRPVAPALGWQCLRGQSLTDRWKLRGLADRIPSVTGLPLDPHFSASKIAWILSEIPGARHDADQGYLAFGTVDSWLIYCLTDGRVHATDPSNASRTMLFDLDSKDWSAELLDEFEIPRSLCPEIRSSDGDFGTTTLGGALQEPLPIRAVLGDSHAALFGMGCYRAGQAKATYGTGSSVMMNVGTSRPKDKSALVTSVAWALGGQVFYALEGNIHHSGDTLRWLVDDMKLFPDLKSWEIEAVQTPDAQGVYFVPGFSGLGAPWWDEGARGALIGLSRGSTRAHIARAALESLAYQVDDLLIEMRRTSGLSLNLLHVDGGPTKNAVLMQFQSDTAQVPVWISGASNASIYGIATLAGYAVGFWPSLEALEELRASAGLYLPQMPDEPRVRRLQGWAEAVRRVQTSGK